jgi:hypothetical protein
MVEIAGALIALGGLAFGLYQYYIAQKWQRSEFAAKQLELLTSDRAIAFCCTVLDYSERRLPTPPEYSVFTDDKSFVHTPQLMVEGLRLETGADHFEWPLVLYRDSFDRFFDYLEAINHYISIGLFRTRDVSNLKYWLHQLACPRFVPEGQNLVFVSFISAYNFQGVTCLMKRFGVEFSSSSR